MVVTVATLGATTMQAKAAMLLIITTAGAAEAAVANAGSHDSFGSKQR